MGLRQITVVVLASALLAAGAAASGTLNIYFIDVEGGQATLIVTPAGQSLLVDAGFAGADGTFQSKPGDPRLARDARRIATAARDAGVTRIDDLLITHFHADHIGGVAELARLLPIGTFIDHGGVESEAETNVPGTLDAFAAYADVRRHGRHLTPSPGARLPLKGVNAVVVSAAGKTLQTPLPGAGALNPACVGTGLAAQEVHENPRSTGFLLEFGTFRFLDVGDLTGAALLALACPRDLIGSVDLYLVAHHGGADAAEPATFAAFKPRAAVVNNGETKGGAAETFALMQQVMKPDAIWQLHRSANVGARNVADGQIANLDDTTAHWIKVTASEDGSFRVTNGRTGAATGYRSR